jgi:hypothetical protein
VDVAVGKSIGLGVNVAKCVGVPLAVGTFVSFGAYGDTVPQAEKKIISKGMATSLASVLMDLVINISTAG